MIYLLKAALLSHYYNFKRSLSTCLILFFSLVALMLFWGYYKHTEAGITLGSRLTTGDLVIKDINQDSPNSEEDLYFDSDELFTLNTIIAPLKGVKKKSYTYDLSGLIGDGQKSVTFFGSASDDLSSLHSLDFVAGDLPYDDELGLILAEGLAKTLNVGVGDYPTIMASSPLEGLSLASLPVLGIVRFPSSQGNKSLLFTNSLTLKDLLGEGVIANGVRIDLSSEKELESSKFYLLTAIKEKIPHLKVYDWKEMSASFEQVIKLYRSFFFFLFTIFFVLVSVSITQFISAILNERMNEIGTLRALGYNKKEMIFSIFAEILSLYLLSLLIAVLFVLCVEKILSVKEIIYVPPGYNDGYPINVLLSFRDYAVLSLTLLVPILISLIPSSLKIINKPIKELLHYV